MSIPQIIEWFKKAVPEPNNKNFNTQFGCDLEELAEMCDSLAGTSLESDDRLKNFRQIVHDMAEALKSGEIQVEVTDKVAFLDAACDRVVTTTGMVVYEGMDFESALSEVNASNWSKFDIDGNPIFDTNMKVQKGPHYWKPDLESYIKN